MVNPMDMDDTLVFRERFAARLRALRHELGLTTAEVAARIGCTIRHYNKLERREVWVADSMLVRLRKALRLDEVDFFVFPDANPLRHGIYDLLRNAPEEVLLKTKLFVLEELRRQGAARALESPSAAAAITTAQPEAVGERKKR